MDGAGSEFLTARQEAIVKVMRDWMDDYGYPPTVREIAAAVGLSSPSSVVHHLRAMERKGVLSHRPGHSRTYQLHLL
ncbi:hypothetical protein AB0M29_02515 [Streptomyces sp. NPDC051976]|uniref:LexA family protein n=1 Tax=Streptomyces sp. NPDC051976 TaxID=3154947 RepID=UPI00341F35DA